MAQPATETVLERLTRLHPKVIDLSLGRIERLLARLGHPERRLPPAVHVAGTNGKGSVVAYLRAMAEAAGRRAHVYTSPHLVRFHERIRLAGRLIEERELYELLLECEAANGEAPITFFEITTAAAFLAFARHPADVLLLEVGLGGRLDATNVVERPAVTVITPVSMDHMDYLGDSLPKIAFEKAGILKAGVPAVIGPQAPEALAVIEARAGAVGAAPLLRHGRDWTAAPTPDGFLFHSPRGERRLPRPGLLGPHQIDNAGTAVAAAELLREPLALSDAAFAAGVARVEWPARMQRLTRGPLAAKLPPGWELWLDGGHNAGAGEALAATVAAWADRPVHLVTGMMGTKVAVDFLSPLAPHCADLKAVPIPRHDKALTPAALAAAARAAGLAAATAPDVAGAVDRILAAGGPPARILICGSLYLAGTVLAENG